MRAMPLNARTALPKKQHSTNEQWVRAWADIERLVSRDEIDDLVERTVADVRATVARLGGRAAYGWSGGKDSVALDYVVRLAGVEEAVMGITNLEYPAFLRWVTDHMPDGLEIVNTGLDIQWLAANPRFLFPQGADGPAWFARVQHKAQRDYFKRRKVDLLILGRRFADLNYTGKGKEGIYTDGHGVVRYSPIQWWRHEDVLGLCHYYRLPLPPIYGWPRGWQVGTGAWPARQWTRSEAHGWREVWAIDPSIVRMAADHFPGAMAQCAESSRSSAAELTRSS